MVQDAVVLLEVVTGEDFREFFLRCIEFQRLNRNDEVLLVVEVFFRK